MHFQRADVDPDVSNLYTDYKKGYPRFRYLPDTVDDIHVIVFSDRAISFEPLDEHVFVPDIIDPRFNDFSHEIVDSYQAQEVASLPFPYFAPFFRSRCRLYVKTRDAPAAMAVEQLVDGLNLDEDWCRRHLQLDEIDFALDRVKTKNNRIDYYSDNEVTCFIANEGVAKKVRSLPGFVESLTFHQAETGSWLSPRIFESLFKAWRL